jgi:hypothetical protein
MTRYEYNGWKLFFREVKLKNSPKHFKIYFFSKKSPKSGSPVAAEEFKNMNAIIKENPKTKLPFIKRGDNIERQL